MSSDIRGGHPVCKRLLAVCIVQLLEDDPSLSTEYHNTRRQHDTSLVDLRELPRLRQVEEDQ